MTVSREDIERITALASLTPNPTSMPQLVRDIEEIVEFVGQLKTVSKDAAGFDDADSTNETPLRADVLAPIPLDQPIAEFAPDYRDGFFVVPRLGGV